MYDSAVGSSIGESDAVLAVASAQLVFASKVRFGSPDFACRMNMGGYGLIPYFKRYVRGVCKMTEEMQTESDYFPLRSATSVYHFGRDTARRPVVTPVSTGGAKLHFSILDPIESCKGTALYNSLTPTFLKKWCHFRTVITQPRWLTLTFQPCFPLRVTVRQRSLDSTTLISQP